MYLKKKNKSASSTSKSATNSPQQQQLSLALDNQSPVLKEKPVIAKHLQPQEEDGNRPILGKKRKATEIETTPDAGDVEAQIEAIADTKSDKSSLQGIPLYQEKRINQVNEIISDLTNDLHQERLARLTANTDFESSLDGYSADYSAFLSSYE